MFYQNASFFQNALLHMPQTGEQMDESQIQQHVFCLYVESHLHD